MRLSQCLVPKRDLENLLSRSSLSFDDVIPLFFSDRFEGGLVYKPLGLRVFSSVTSEMSRDLEGIGATELCMPLLIDLETISRSRRVSLGLLQNFGIAVPIGGRDFLLMPTHEEAMMLLYDQSGVAPEMRPLWYQYGKKFRNEMPEPPLRLREFTMLDAYSFAESETGLREDMDLFISTLRASLSRLGVSCYAGPRVKDRLFGDESVELLIRSSSGRDRAHEFDEGAGTCSTARGTGAHDEEYEPVMEVAHCYLLFRIYNTLLENRREVAGSTYFSGHGIGIDRVAWGVLEQSWKIDRFEFTKAARLADAYVRPEAPYDPAAIVKLERETQAQGRRAIVDDLALPLPLSRRLAELLDVDSQF